MSKQKRRQKKSTPPANGGGKAANKNKGWIDFASLRQRLSLRRVLDAHGVRLRVSDATEQASGFCPLPTHPRSGGEGSKPKSPSFSAHLGRGVWQCFGCGAKGNVLDLAVRMEGLDPDNTQSLREGAKRVEERFFGGGAEIIVEPTQEAPVQAPQPRKGRRSRPEAASASPEASDAPERAPVADEEVVDATEAEEEDARERVINPPLSFTLTRLDPDHPYLRDRGFTPETVEYFGLGYCSRGLMKGRIAIPIHNPQGDLVGYAGRLVDDDAVDAQHPKYLLPGPVERDGVAHEFRKSELLYNLHAVDPDHPLVVIVEGYPSVWWLWQNKVDNAVALMGASMSPQQARLLLDVTPASTDILILTDGDDAGDRAAASVFQHLGTSRWCRRMELPLGGQPTDLTAQEVREMIDSLIGGPL